MKATRRQRRSILLGLILSASAAFLVSCGSTDIPTATELTTMVSHAPNTDLEDRVGAEIASFRRSKGLRVQTRHAGLDKLARMHAQQMLKRQKMDHDNYHHRLGMAEKYYEMAGLRENVAHGSGFSRAEMSRVTVDGWIASAGHRRNLLTKNTHYGVGVAIGEDGSFYSAQVTASPVVDTKESSAFRKGMPISYSNKYGAAMGPDW